MATVMSRVCLTILSLSLFVCHIAAIPTISAIGSKFFTSDGNQFYIKGVAYQLIDQDPLVDEAQCQLDAALMAQLGANTIRVYHVDSGADHSGCMNAFADKGIYLFVDMDTIGTYIRLGGITSWNQTKSDEYRAVMDNFQKFDNTAGFFVGNEVLNVASDSPAAPYVLAATADLKSYRQEKNYRDIPIGYSATDTAVLRPMLQDYLVCRPNATERLDFYSLNSYEWCGSASTYTISGYDILQQYANDYPVPIFLSEDGCNTVPPRDFADQASIFGSEMSGTWSGAIIYEWIQETNSYGLVSYGPFTSGVNEGSSVIDGYTRQGTPTPIAPDFTNLQHRWATLTPSGVASSAYAAQTGTITLPVCPSSTAGGWVVDPSAPLPPLGAAVASGSLASGAPSGSPTSSASSGASSPSAKSAAGKASVNPVSSSETSLMGMVAALMTVGAAFVWWL